MTLVSGHFQSAQLRAPRNQDARFREKSDEKDPARLGRESVKC